MSTYQGNDWFREQMIAAAQEALDKGWIVKGDPRTDRIIIAYPPERAGEVDLRWRAVVGSRVRLVGLPGDIGTEAWDECRWPHHGKDGIVTHSHPHCGECTVQLDTGESVWVDGSAYDSGYDVVDMEPK